MDDNNRFIKYIPVDKLIAEIEKRQEELSDHNFHSMVDEYDKVLDIIYSLQQEQPEVDLDKYFRGWHIEEEIGLTQPDGWSCIVDDLKDIARHFYELGLNARKEE